VSDGRLRLLEYPDLKHDVVRQLVTMVETKEAAAALLAFLRSSETGLSVLRETGGLEAHLYAMSSAVPRQASAPERELLDRIVRTAVLIEFKSWTLEPETQLEWIRKNEWKGRYVGFWHIHPPSGGAVGLAAGFEPSTADLAGAVEHGQLVTIVFRPEGFDFYDLSEVTAVETGYSETRVVSYRSPDWQALFTELLRKRTSRALQTGRAALQ